MKKRITFVANGKTYRLPVEPSELSFEALSLMFATELQPLEIRRGETAAECLERHAAELKARPVSRLKFYRMQKGLTIDELSWAADVSSGQITAIENRRINISNISLRNAVKLAEALDVQPSDLLDEGSVDEQ